MPDTNTGAGSGTPAPITVGVEVVLFTIRGDALHVLLAPGAEAWHLPHGRLRASETLDAAARRALADAAGPTGVWLEQLYTFGDIGRTPDQRVVSVAWYALVAAAAVPYPGARAARWWPIATLPLLVHDHRRIIEYALARLRNKLEYTTVGFQLLPPRFTLSDLQHVYEAILGRALDKRNFRRKVELLGIVKPTREQRVSGTGRPAQLYAFAAAEAPESLGAPEPLDSPQPHIQLARISPVLRRRGRTVPATSPESSR